MSSESVPDFPVLKIVQILDKSTIVVTGHNVDHLTVDEELLILARGTQIPGLPVPLIVPKATVVVTDVAGVYAIAKAPMITVEEKSAWVALAEPLGPAKRTVKRRAQLSVDEDSLAGNPAVTPIAVGDPVIRRENFAEYVATLAS